MSFVACYDLEHQICSTDFYGWLIEQAHYGAHEITFKTDKWRPGSLSYPDHIMRRRFETMIRPGPAFLGLPSREGSDGERGTLGFKHPHLMRFARQHKNFRRLKSVQPPRRDVRYTVTIREATKAPWRNSNKAAWLEFAAEIGAHVIPDYAVEPFHWHDLMALYAGAQMNFGVSGGPMHVCSLSEYPCMIFKCEANRNYFLKTGMQYGEGWSWCKETQHVFWDDDTPKNIRRRFDEWLIWTKCMAL